MKRILTITLACAAFGLVSGLGADVKENWDKHCVKCHGKDGSGKTAMGKKLKVLDYTKAEDQKKFTDEEAIKITKEGKKDGNRTLMKPYSDVLSDDEIKALVKLIREMQK